MKFPSILLWLSALFVAVQAQSQTQTLMSELPSCALTCILKSLPDSGCSMTDIPCICANEQMWTNVSSCVVPACSSREALNATRIAQHACGRPVRDKSHQLYIVGPTFAGIALLFIILRVLARRPGVSDLFGWDDGLVMVAWGFGAPLAASHILLGMNGLGQDVWNVPLDNLDRAFMWFYIAETFYLFSSVFVRLSILAFYLRVFVDYVFRRVVYTVMAINAAFAIGFLFPLIFQCSPISAAWKRWDTDVPRKCINVNGGIWSHAAINIVLDLIVLILPLRQLFRLHIANSLTKKIHIFVMFSFGIIVTIISVLRLRTLITLGQTENPTWDDFGAAIWSVLEVQIAIICACLPHAKLFFTRLVPQWLGLTVKDTNQNYAHGTPAQNSSATLSSKRQSKIAQNPVRISEIPADSEFVELQSNADSQRQSLNKDDIGLAK